MDLEEIKIIMLYIKQKVTRNPQIFNATGLNNTLEQYSTFKNTTLTGYDNNLQSNINTMRNHLSTFKNRVQTSSKLPDRNDK